jgi:hypothetical protein
MHKIACQHAKLLGNICKMRCNMGKARQHEQVGQHLQDCMAKCSMLRGNMSKLLWQQAQAACQHAQVSQEHAKGRWQHVQVVW